MRNKQDEIVKLVGDGNAANDDLIICHLNRGIKDLLVNVAGSRDEWVEPEERSWIVVLRCAGSGGDLVNNPVFAGDPEHFEMSPKCRYVLTVIGQGASWRWKP